jgi:hypothetical protein
MNVQVILATIRDHLPQCPAEPRSALNWLARQCALIDEGRPDEFTRRVYEYMQLRGFAHVLGDCVEEIEEGQDGKVHPS